MAMRFARGNAHAPAANSAPVEAAAYLEVKYAEKEEAKAAGAKWDLQKRKWYVPANLTGSMDRFSKWTPENAVKRNRKPGDYIAEKSERVYLSRDVTRLAATSGALWDPDFPPDGAYYVPPNLTHDLRRFSQWLPEDVQAGGAASAAADADVKTVVVPIAGLPQNTLKWVYFYREGALMRRARRWTRSGSGNCYGELLTQWEYNRRVEDPEWPEYAPDEELDGRDGVPEEHGGGVYDMPDVELDRRKQNHTMKHGSTIYTFDAPQPFSLYEPDAARVEKKRGQYRDVDELVRNADGSVPASSGGGTKSRCKRTSNKRARNPGCEQDENADAPAQ